MQPVSRALKPPRWMRLHAAEERTLTEMEGSEYGYYTRLRLLLFERQGRLADDKGKWIARQIGCSTYAWNKMRSGLLARGLLQLHDGYLTSRYVTIELDHVAAVAEQRRVAGQKGLAVRYGKKQRKPSVQSTQSNQSNALGLANASVSFAGVSLRRMHDMLRPPVPAAKDESFFHLLTSCLEQNQSGSSSNCHPESIAAPAEPKVATAPDLAKPEARKEPASCKATAARLAVVVPSTPAVPTCGRHQLSLRKDLGCVAYNLVDELNKPGDKSASLTVRHQFGDILVGQNWGREELTWDLKREVRQAEAKFLEAQRRRRLDEGEELAWEVRREVRRAEAKFLEARRRLLDEGTG